MLNASAPPFDRRRHLKYSLSRYRLNDYDVFPGYFNAEFDAHLAANQWKSYTFLTAYNPYFSTIMPRGENKARARVLRQEIRSKGYSFAPAFGVDPLGEWPDDAGLVVYDIPLAEALQVGRRWHQNAILYGQRGQAAAVLWCDCLLGQVQEGRPDGVREDRTPVAHAR